MSTIVLKRISLAIVRFTIKDINKNTIAYMLISFVHLQNDESDEGIWTRQQFRPTAANPVSNMRDRII